VGGAEVVVVLVHSLDGSPGLRTRKAQAALARLLGDGSLEHGARVRLVCSVDHVHFPLLWDQELLARFRWCWQDATTLEPFDGEARRLLDAHVAAGAASEARAAAAAARRPAGEGRGGEGEGEGGGGEGGALQSSGGGSAAAAATVRSVLSALTDRQVKLLKLLQGQGARAGLTKPALLDACKRALLVKTLPELEQYLVDVLHHGLASWGPGQQAGAPVLTVAPAAVPVLETI
jgi:hypothetical protein